MYWHRSRFNSDYDFVSKENKNQAAFIALVRAGLWENSQKCSVESLEFRDSVDWEEVYCLASEQAVLGLVLAGIDFLPIDQRPPKVVLLQWIGEIQMLEQQNQSMNHFIGELVDRMRKEGIYALLVKGQGVAQCYEKPLWRSCGDVDFLLSADNYDKAKEFLAPLAAHVDEEDAFRKHLGMTIDPWIVELHGTMNTELSKRVNRGIEEVQNDLFYGGNVRSWMNEGTQIFLPNADNDIIIIFTHFIQHFYVGGVGLRQVCDWCRLLWTYREKIDRKKLERKLKNMGLMEEWRSFGVFAVEQLGMPKEAMPFYKTSGKQRRKANRICKLILRSGSFGFNQDQSYRSKYPGVVAKTITLWLRIGEFMRLTAIFSMNAPKFFIHYFCRRFGAFLTK